MYKDEKTLMQGVQKIIVFIVLYANLWRSRCRRRPTKTLPFVLLNTVFLWPSQFEQKQHTSSGNKFVAAACMLFLYYCSRIFARENTLQVVFGVGFAYHLWKNWRKTFKPITKRSSPSPLSLSNLCAICSKISVGIFRAKKGFMVSIFSFN